MAHASPGLHRPKGVAPKGRERELLERGRHVGEHSRAPRAGRRPTIPRPQRTRSTSSPPRPALIARSPRIVARRPGASPQVECRTPDDATESVAPADRLPHLRDAVVPVDQELLGVVRSAERLAVKAEVELPIGSLAHHRRGDLPELVVRRRPGAPWRRGSHRARRPPIPARSESGHPLDAACRFAQVRGHARAAPRPASRRAPACRPARRRSASAAARPVRAPSCPSAGRARAGP